MSSGKELVLVLAKESLFVGKTNGLKLFAIYHYNYWL